MEESYKFRILFTPLEKQLLYIAYGIFVCLLMLDILLSIYLMGIFPRLKYIATFAISLSVLLVPVITLYSFYISSKGRTVYITRKGIRYGFPLYTKWGDILSIIEDKNKYHIKYNLVLFKARILTTGIFILPSYEESLRFRDAVSKFSFVSPILGD